MCEKHPTVSVVITAYNYGLFLPEAIESVLRQTFKDLEVIVVDDGSTDNTSEVILPYLSNPCFRYIRKENGGQASAKNRGVNESKGEFIAFLDADDVWFPTKLEKQMPFFSDPKVGVVYSKRVLIDTEGNERPFEHPRLYRGRVLNQIFINNFVCFSSVIIKRECFEKIGTFDETLPMAIDYDLWLRIALHYHFDYVDEPLVKYRVGHGHMSENKEKRFDCAWQVMNNLLKNPSLKSYLSWWVPAYAKAHTYGNMGIYYISKNQWVGLRYFMTSLRYNPFYLFSWKGLIKGLFKLI
jgi:glycosyltransferase involved in cell wall biosynthesis